MAVTTYWGLSTAQWQVVGVAGGLFIGIVGLGINAFFQYLNYRKNK